MDEVLRLSVEYATREVSCLSFTVKTLLLTGATELVSIWNISCYIDIISPVRENGESKVRRFRAHNRLTKSIQVSRFRLERNASWDMLGQEVKNFFWFSGNPGVIFLSKFPVLFVWFSTSCWSGVHFLSQHIPRCITFQPEARNSWCLYSMFPMETSFVAPDNSTAGLTVKLGRETSLVAYSTDKRSTPFLPGEVLTNSPNAPYLLCHFFLLFQARFCKSCTRTKWRD